MWRSSGSRSGKTQSWLTTRAAGPGKVGQAEQDWLGPWRIPGAQLSLQAAPCVKCSCGGGSHERRGARGLCPAGLTPQPQAACTRASKPQTIPSYLAKAHFFFFSKFEDLINRRGERGSYRRNSPRAKRLSLETGCPPEELPERGSSSGALRTGCPMVMFTGSGSPGRGQRHPWTHKGEGGSSVPWEASRQEDPRRHLNL